MESPSLIDVQIEPDSAYWLSIDVGIVHLALVLVRVTPEFELARIVWHQLFDIRRLKHKRVSEDDCELGHTATITDRMAHIYQEHRHLFEMASRILVERQPITGLQAVQESLFAAWRDKLELVSPGSMHRDLRLRGDYEARKVQSVNLARHYFYARSNPVFPAGYALEDASPEMCLRFECYLDKSNGNEKRSHDVADAVCIAVFVLRREAKELARQRRKRELAAKLPGSLEQYRRVRK